MIKQFAVVVSEHRRLGVLLQTFILTKNSSQSFHIINEPILPDHIEKSILQLTDEQKKIVAISYEYSEKQIHKVFSKKQNLRDFFNDLTPDYSEKFIRPYIERRIHKIVEILKNAEIPLLIKDKNSHTVYTDDWVDIVKEKAQVVFNFTKDENGLKYLLTVRDQNQDLKLSQLTSINLSNHPTIVILNNKLYCIDNIDSKKLLPFFTKDFILIPQSMIRDYMETFIKNAIQSYPVKATGFTIDETVKEKKAILSPETNLKNEPVLSLTFKYGDVLVPYGTESGVLVDLKIETDNYTFYKIARESVWENEIINLLEKSGLIVDTGTWFKPATAPNEKINESLYTLINWINVNLSQLQQEGLICHQLHFKEYFFGSITQQMKITENNDWFDINAVVQFGEYPFPLSRLKRYIIQGIREFKLPNGQIAILPEVWFSKYKDLLVMGESDETIIKIKKYNYSVIPDVTKKSNPAFIKKTETLFSEGTIDDIDIPEGLLANLRDYQKKGFYWMYRLYKNNFGGCLADDMGLGKTLQALTLLMKIKEEHHALRIKQLQNNDNQLSLFNDFFSELTGATSIIVMPVSLIHNWENEIRKFTPSMRIHKFIGLQRTKNIFNFQHIDIVLTSYGIVRNTIEDLQRFRFKYVILDESQLIKNPGSKTYKAIEQINAEHRMVLTGTPIENSLTDLWSQFNFLNKGLLGSLHYFKDEYVQPIEKNQDMIREKRLQVMIHPFILRRKKEEVAPELPDLTEQVLYCEMTESQQKIYESEKSKIRNLIFEQIENKGMEKSAILILKALNKLRLLANHPVMVDRDYKDDSGKFDEITRRIGNVVEGGNKVLIFSFYVLHLEIIEQYLKTMKWSYSMLTGSVKESDRQQKIEMFQKDPDNKIFLISLTAGGVGLNLTAADYVFILDPWWNPAREQQAISRAHRIGQSKKVFVYRFISLNTIEEKIQLLQGKKSALAQLFINSNNPFKNMNKEVLTDFFD